MYSNLATAYMRDEVERRLLATKANRQALIDEAMSVTPRRSWTMHLRHQLATLLVSVGTWLDDRPRPVFPAGLDEALNPTSQNQP